MLFQLISECTDYDFKVALEKRKPKSWLKSVSAFANTIGGTLFFGVDNDKRIVGIENPQETSDFISETINARIKPTPTYVLTPYEEEGKIVICVKIYSGTATPYYYDADGVKEAYIRSGNESIVAPNHILNELILKGTNQTYDTIKTRYKKSDYSFTFFEATFFETTHTRIKPEDYLSFNLVAEDGNLTNAGVLLADQNIYRHSRIFCTRWNGTDKTASLGEAIDDKEISGGIVNQLYAVMDFIRSNTKKKWRKAGLTRIESPEYDEEALREAVVNGIIHREYTRLGAEVSVDIYDNRIEITSPGSMFSGKRIDKTIDRVVVSERRNPVLADVFARMRFMERRGSGLKKITDKTNALFGDGKSHVEFYSDNNFFKVIIYNANYGIEDSADEKSSTVNSTVNSTVKLSKTERSIIEFIEEDADVTIEAIALRLGKTESTIKKAIKKLKAKEIVVRVGADKTGFWQIKR